MQSYALLALYIVFAIFKMFDEYFSSETIAIVLIYLILWNHTERQLSLSNYCLIAEEKKYINFISQKAHKCEIN